MPEITLEAVKARHTELGEMIAQLQRQAMAQTITLGAVTLQLHPGERYAGAVLKNDGSVDYHLIKLPAEPDDDMSWRDAMDWAESVGGKLPDRREMRLLQANLGATLKTSGWGWLEETNGESCAWYCTFYGGGVDYTYRSSEGSAVAVRRFNP